MPMVHFIFLGAELGGEKALRLGMVHFSKGHGAFIKKS
jgi:hypothetical protein